MIAKISKGHDFRGLSAYLARDGRGQVLEMRQLSSDDPESAAGEMRLAASLSARTQQPVMHISVSYDPADGQVSDDQMRADAAEVLRGQGLDRAQAVIVRHDDAGHPHFHIMANRVGPDGRAVSDSQSYPRAEASMRRLEARHGYAGTPGRHAPEYSTGARMTGPRTSADSRQIEAPGQVRDTLMTAKSWPELHAGLARHGWRLERVQKGNRAPGGLLIGPNGEKIASGRVDRSCTLSRLDARLSGGQVPRQPTGQAQAPAARPGLSPRAMAGGTAGAGIAKKISGKRGKTKDRMQAGGRVMSQIAMGIASGSPRMSPMGRRGPGIGM